MKIEMIQPKGLGIRGQAFWLTVCATHAPDDAGEVELLVEAARVVDLIDRLRTELDNSDLVTFGSAGQPKSHPLLPELARAQLTLRGLLRQLNLPEVFTGPNLEAVV